MVIILVNTYTDKWGNKNNTAKFSFFIFFLLIQIFHFPARLLLC